MIVVRDAEDFPRQLLVWGVRGLFCASPSFYWAWKTQFSQPVELLAMIAGVATYVVGFAWLTSGPDWRGRANSDEFARLLEMAANTRAAFSPAMAFGPDLWLGFASIMFVQSGARLLGIGVDDIATANSFGFTYCTTLVQGTLVSATIYLLVLLVWGGRGIWRWARH